MAFRAAPFLQGIETSVFHAAYQIAYVPRCPVSSGGLKPQLLEGCRRRRCSALPRFFRGLKRRFRGFSSDPRFRAAPFLQGIETWEPFVSHAFPCSALPRFFRGLKHLWIRCHLFFRSALPRFFRGLKREGSDCRLSQGSALPRFFRGLKRRLGCTRSARFRAAPFLQGIETQCCRTLLGRMVPRCPVSSGD